MSYYCRKCTNIGKDDDSCVTTDCKCACHATPPQDWEKEWQRLKCDGTIVGTMVAWENTKDVQFIKSLLQKEREKTLKDIESALEDYFLSSYPLPDHRVIMGYIRESLKTPLPSR